MKWLADVGSLIRLIIAVGVWKGYPVAMFMLFAALQNIPVELKEATYIDGASELKRIWHVVLPLLSPSLRSWYP